MVQEGRRLAFLSLVAGAMAGVLSSALLASTGVFAQGRAPSVSSAEEFRLVDQNGRPRARLALSASGQPYLTLLDDADRGRVWLGIAEDTGMSIRDVDGKTRLLMTVDTAGEPSLVFRDRQQNTRILQPSGQPQ